MATAYFTVGGFGLLREGLLGLGNLRLLLGAEPTSGEQLGLRPHAGNVTRLIRRDLEALPFDEKTLRLVEDLIAYLRRNTVLVRLHDKGFLHAKCWLFYSDCPGQQLLFDRFRPILASGWVSACWPSEPRGSEADLFRLYQRGIEKPPSRRQQAQRLARGL